MTNQGPLSPPPTTLYLARPGGRVGYDVAGEGPLLVLVPGLGDLRQAYRYLAPALRQAGYRVAVADLRGHGDSDATFSSYGDVETAGDLVALVEELGGPAVLVGNSMAAAAATLAAAERPELVSGLVLVGPVVRQPPAHPALRALTRVAMARPWAATAWNWYLPKLYAGRRPADFEAYRAQVVASLRRPGYTRAFVLTTRLNHDQAEARLPEVATPALVLMGEQDPDFADPPAEADWVAGAVGGQVVMVPESGHYPQSQRPDLAIPAVLGFLATLAPHA